MITDRPPVLRATVHAPGWRIDVLTRASLRHRPQDDWLVMAAADGSLRAAVIDGVTPRADSDGAHGLDAGAFAAAIIRAHLLEPGDPVKQLLAAGRALHVPGHAHRAQRAATVLVAELAPSGDTRLVRACDTEAWVASAGRWSAVFGPALRAAASTRWEAFRAEHPDVRPPSAAWLAANERILGADEAWTSHPVGSRPTPRLEERRIRVNEALLIATDGLGSRRAGPAGVPALVGLLGNGEPEDDDDVTALLIRHTGHRPVEGPRRSPLSGCRDGA